MLPRSDRRGKGYTSSELRGLSTEPLLVLRLFIERDRFPLTGSLECDLGCLLLRASLVVVRTGVNMTLSFCLDNSFMGIRSACK